MIEYGNVQLSLLDGYDLNKSSQTVSFSNLTCDFTGHTSEDLPQKYQECKVYVNNVLKFVGYINGYSFREMRETDNFLEISIELLSPMAMATLRTQIATGNYSLNNLIELVFQPLIDDGFIIRELNITNRNVTVNYVYETIEYIMSDLSNKYNLWWFIDENKQIYVKDVDMMLNENPKHFYDETHKFKGLMYLKPSVSSQDYANVINFTNVRTYQLSRKDLILWNQNPLIDNFDVNIKKGDEISFNFPIDFKEDNIIKSANSYISEAEIIHSLKYFYGLNFKGTYTDSSTFEVYFRYDIGAKKWERTNNFDFEGNTDTDKEFLLIRDSFFSNLITGFKYNGNKTINKITEITSNSALIWNINRFYNDEEINKNKNKTNQSGIIEITLDMNEQWKTLPELINIGTSYANNSSLTLDGQLEVAIDRDIFKIGDIIKINKMLFNGTYIFTQIKEVCKKNHSQYIATCKNVDIKNNYINLFRSKTKQENDERVFQTYITHYTQEGIKESHEVVK